MLAKDFQAILTFQTTTPFFHWTMPWFGERVCHNQKNQKITWQTKENCLCLGFQVFVLPKKIWPKKQKSTPKTTKSFYTPTDNLEKVIDSPPKTPHPFPPFQPPLPPSPPPPPEPPLAPPRLSPLSPCRRHRRQHRRADEPRWHASLPKVSQVDRWKNEGFFFVGTAMEKIFFFFFSKCLSKMNLRFTKQNPNQNQNSLFKRTHVPSYAL